MLKRLRKAVFAALALGGLAFQAAPAAAMPMVDPAPAHMASAPAAAAAEPVRWVCGPYRCFHRPNFGPRFYRPYGWHRPFYGYHRPFYGYHRPYYGYRPYRGWRRPHYGWRRPVYYGYHRPWHHGYGWHRGYGW